MRNKWRNTITVLFVSDEIPACVPGCFEDDKSSGHQKIKKLTACHPAMDQSSDELCHVPRLPNTNLRFDHKNSHRIGDIGTIHCNRGFINRLNGTHPVKQVVIYCATPSGADTPVYVDEYFGQKVQSCEEGCLIDNDCQHPNEFCHKVDFVCKKLPACSLSQVRQLHWLVSSSQDDVVIGGKITVTCPKNSTHSGSSTDVEQLKLTCSSEGLKFLKPDGNQLTKCNSDVPERPQKCLGDFECDDHQICDPKRNVCKNITCSIESLQEIGLTSNNTNEEFQFGDNITAICQTSFKILIPPQLVTCSKNGEWLKPDGSRVISCPQVRPCQRDQDCPGQVCSLLDSTCVDCNDDSDCESDKYCMDGTTCQLKKCHTNNDCPNGLNCNNNGVCKTPEACHDCSGGS